MKFQLAHKVLLVIAVPIALQLGLLWFFTGFLDRLDANQALEQELTEAGLLRDRGYVLVNQRMLLYGMYRATKDPIYLAKYKENDKTITEGFKILAELWQGDPRKMEALEESWRLNRRFSSFASLMMLGEKQDHISGLLGGNIGMTLLHTHIGSPDYYNHAVERVFAESEDGLAPAAKQIRSAENSMKVTLLFALLASLVTGIASGLFFSRSISDRLKLVVQNIKVMGKRDEELVRVAGSDEITVLNDAIIDTASKIADAEDFQAQTARIIAQELERPLETVSQAFADIRVSGFAQLNEKGTLRLDQVDGEISRVRNLVKDLVSLDGIRDVGWDLKVHGIDLADVARMAVDIVRDLARSGGVELVVRGNTMPVVGDPDRLVQIAVNLLANAIKFSPPGAVVEVNVELDETSGGGRLSITDHGPGVSPEFHNKIFGRFEQDRALDSSNKTGSGLGLAISKLLIEAQHGQMGFTSEPGTGSTFWLTLPVAGAKLQPAANQNENDAPAISPSTTPGSWRNTLWQKALALVALPLLVQLITVSVLWVIISSMSSNLVDFKAARQMAHTHSTLVNEIARSTFYAMLFNARQNPDLRDKTLADHKRLYEMAADLRRTSKGNAELTAKADELQEMIDAHVALQKDIMQAEPDAQVDRWFGPPHGAQTEQLLIQMQAPMDEAIESTRASIDSRILASGAMRRNIETVLVASAVITALISAGLGLFMMRRLTLRVRRVVANTVRLANREPLNAPQPGTDEVAFVDHSFYDAGTRLTELERFKQQMISVTSHELRTPLTSLLATADLIAGKVFGPLTAGGEIVLNRARHNISSLIAMITNLLDTEKIQSGKTLVQRAPAELDAILSSAEESIRELARDRHIEIRTDRSGLFTQADSKRLVQALTAVLNEIAEQAPEGSVIVLESKRDEQGLALRVRAPRRGLQTETTSQRASERLALDLSRMIAEQHGGSLELNSEDDGENVLSIKLPDSA